MQGRLLVFLVELLSYWSSVCRRSMPIWADSVSYQKKVIPKKETKKKFHKIFFPKNSRKSVFFDMTTTQDIRDLLAYHGPFVGTVATVGTRGSQIPWATCRPAVEITWRQLKKCAVSTTALVFGHTTCSDSWKNNIDIFRAMKTLIWSSHF